MNAHEQLAAYVATHSHLVSQVVEFNLANDNLLQLDFTENNKALQPQDIADTARFSHWVNTQLKENGCRYGIGGYMEHRTVYSRSALFDTGEEPRRLHLGTDIWAEAGTPVYAPLQGTVHSFHDNDCFGDYGPTIILQHNLNGLTLFSLYGHLNRESLNGLQLGGLIEQGQQIATFGAPHENGSWPPHLHFQLMFDMQGRSGDYPGVCQYSQKDEYQRNIPDPEVILQFSGATIM
jgi:murein DD-endopeptidase MepM/ murein hydrolase activator NlpD